MNTFVRRYRCQDRAGVRRVYADTAFFGGPVERFFDDRELFADIGVDVYLDHYADNIFVAENEGRVVGYILGSPEGDAAVRAHLVRKSPLILLHLIRGHYHLGRKSLCYAAKSLRAALSGELLEIRDSRYPANLHINLESSHRGQGLGRELLRTYLEHLRSENVPGVHLVTTSQNGIALRLYQHMGFRLLAQKQTQLWQSYLKDKVHLMAFGRILDQASM